MPCLQITMREKKLDKRLTAVASYINKGDAVADIGSDHAYLPLYLLTNNLSERVLVSDLRDGPLESAKRNFTRYGLADKLVTMKYDGIRSDVPYDYDTIVVAGMGGITISGIIEKAKEHLLKCRNKLILQPMTEFEALRRKIFEIGFHITSETIVNADDGKLYTVICAEEGISDEYSYFEYIFGKIELCKNTENYCLSVDRYISSLQSAVKAGAYNKADLLADALAYREQIKGRLQ